MGQMRTAEVMHIEAGDRVIDIGYCSSVFAWQKAGPDGHITFVDSNVRSRFGGTDTPDQRRHGVRGDCDQYRGGAARRSTWQQRDPPALRQPGAIARLFIARARTLLKPGRTPLSGDEATGRIGA